MTQRCLSCNSCGMPFEKPADHALGDIHSEYCIYCTHSDGTLKSYEEILQGMIEFLVQSQAIDKKAAHAIAQETLTSLPAWNKN